MKLAAMGAPWVFTQLGTADLLFHRGDVRVFEQILGNLRSEAQHLGQRGSGRGHDLEHEMAFSKLGQESAFAGGQLCERDGANQNDERDDGARPAGDEAKQPGVARLQPLLHARFAGFANAFTEEQIRQRGSDSQRNQQGGHDREDITQGKRREKAALQTGQCQHRHENQRDDKRGIDHRATDFERGVKNDVEDFASAGGTARYRWTKRRPFPLSLRERVNHGPCWGIWSASGITDDW